MNIARRLRLFLAIVVMVLFAPGLFAQDPGGPTAFEMIDVTLLGNASAATVIAETSVTTGVQTDVTVTSQPIWPRNVKIYVTDANASLSQLKVTVTGKNQYGWVVSEQFLLTEGATTTVARLTGAIAFATVTGVTYESAVGYTAGSVDKFLLAYGSAFGFITPLALASDVFAVNSVTSGALETYSRMSSGAYTIDHEFGTFTPASYAAGAQYVLWMRPSKRVRESRQRNSNTVVE